MVTKKITQAERDVFVADIVAVCNKHNLTLVPYHFDLDKYDSETGLEVELLEMSGTYEIENAEAVIR